MMIFYFYFVLAVSIYIALMNDVTAIYVLERFLLWSDPDSERVDRGNEALDSSGRPPLAVFEAA